MPRIENGTVPIIDLIERAVRDAKTTAPQTVSGVRIAM
jgi:hypothetical protein